MAQFSVNKFRAIALTPTQGLAKGVIVCSSGKPLASPIGKNIYSRTFDLFGNPIDGLPMPKDVN
jgi:F-type H+-transporting ATPase subunit beta